MASPSKAVKKSPRKHVAPKTPTQVGPFRLKRGKPLEDVTAEHVHILRGGFKCKTDSKGYSSPGNASRTRLVVDSSEGYIPLWARGMTLRWRFQKSSLDVFEDPPRVMAAVRDVMGRALLAWGSAVPVKFAERKDAWDFEVAVRNADDCDAFGCTLASAFFPDAGRHTLNIYPEMFEQPDAEQVETLAHEFGHVFGLRHFFAKMQETEWPAEVFGAHKPFSIMNYGAKSKLTATDRKDLARLYSKAWSGELTEINGTRIRLVKPFHLS